MDFKRKKSSKDAESVKSKDVEKNEDSSVKFPPLPNGLSSNRPH